MFSAEDAFPVGAVLVGIVNGTGLRVYRLCGVFFLNVFGR
jgi:hypothetical protein